MNKNSTSYAVQRILKRGIDVVASLAALALLSPVFAVIALAIKIDSPGGVFFRHRRIGKNGRPFDLYKFRTMLAGHDDSNYTAYLEKLIHSDCDGAGLPYVKMQNDERVTRVGRWLRRSYMDEFPQLINVLRGEMSLVGPRPHVQLEVDHYTAEQRRRLSVKPGVTGPWQVNGKFDSTFGQLIQSDLDYIDHWSLWLDVKIILETFLVIVSGGVRLQAYVIRRIRGRVAPAAHPVELPVPARKPPAPAETPFGSYLDLSQVSKEGELWKG